MFCDGQPLFFPLTVPFPPQVFTIKTLHTHPGALEQLWRNPDWHSHTEVTEEIYSFL